MTIRPGSRVLLDTNVLLGATDDARAEHGDCLAVLNVLPSRGVSLYVSGQIIREYLAVATRPVVANGLGMDCIEALENVDAFRGRMELLAENAKVADRLRALIGVVECSGNQVHDANLVATMLVHGIGTVVTLNLAHFTRFSADVDAVVPADAATAASPPG